VSGHPLVPPARRAVAALLVVAAAATPGALAAQSSPAAPPAAGAPPAAPAAPTPAANPADVGSVDAIITALYAVISGPPGQPRDWARMRSLFAPTGRLVPVVPRGEGGFAMVVLTPEDYVRRSGETLTRFGFTEREVARRTEQFGHVVHAWSTYEGRFTAPGAPTAAPIRGINSIQLTSDGTRWYVLSITWEAERPDQPLPERYLRTAP
jgi:hypothetical protein